MKNLYNLIILTVVCLCCVSCDNDDEPYDAIAQRSYRDGVYSKSQTELYIDGTRIGSVTSVIIKSQLISFRDNGTGYYGSSVEIDPVYDTQIKICGFPMASGVGDIEFITVSDMSGFSGQTRIDGRDYSYEGQFTGDPLSHHDRQGIIISFELLK